MNSANVKFQSGSFFLFSAGLVYDKINGAVFDKRGGISFSGIPFSGQNSASYINEAEFLSGIYF